MDQFPKYKQDVCKTIAFVKQDVCKTITFVKQDVCKTIAFVSNVDVQAFL